MNKNKRKILNDPVYGFISIPDDLIFDIIEHPYFQRLRRIQQLGLTHLVYPGALHTRFHHAIGAMHLMDRALNMIESKGTEVTEPEYLSSILAILLHDIGHGPFSHALEHSIVENITHEDISRAIMMHMNLEYSNKLKRAIDIFEGTYHRAFFHQLVSGQLDVDRLDYLTRDSFFTGVSEGVIGTDRIIKMMNVCDDNLVIEEKGIYSIEKFLIARQLMYWQVYLHKTVISAEILLIKILRRAKMLSTAGEMIQATPALEPFLKQSINKEEFLSDRNMLEQFCKLDDFDIVSSVKYWAEHKEPILRDLSNRLLNRRLLKTELLDFKPTEEQLDNVKNIIVNKLGIMTRDASYYFHYGTVESHPYDFEHNPIQIFYRDGSTKNIIDASTTINPVQLTGTQIKHHITYPKECAIEIQAIIHPKI